MKRKIACIGILITIFGLTLWSNHYLTGFTRQLDTALVQLDTAAQAEDWAAAAQAAKHSASLASEAEPILLWICPHGRLSELTTTVNTLEGYAKMELPDLLAESKRARSQLQALNALFFRTF